MTEPAYFPFSAIVGQTDMKDALLCNAVHPEIGGVLIAGTRGTAKSTAARSLAHLLPRIDAVVDCPYNCPPNDPAAQCPDCSGTNFSEHHDLVEQIQTPFVNLPIGATEDRVLGTINLESAIKDGERAFEPGLLARANRGILYIDEVNLLSDHLVDVLLDAVAMGTNRVEREGISIRHPANVMLVGTMNPEEGELRPQLLDRFGLFVTADADLTTAERKTVVQRRTHYDTDPHAMVAEWHEEETALVNRINNARDLFSDIQVGDDLLDRIATICTEHDVDGLRADIIIHRTARALAALDGSRSVENDHVDRAAELALGHRSNSNPRDDPSDPASRDDPTNSPPSSANKPSPDELPNINTSSRNRDEETPSGVDGDPDTTEGNGAEQSESNDDRVFPISPGWDAPRPTLNQRYTHGKATNQGRGARTLTNKKRGGYYAAQRSRGRTRDLALDATIRAAAPHQPARRTRNPSNLAVQLRPVDFREKQRQSPTQHLVVFVVDSSGSMGNYQQMSRVKGAIRSLLDDAYQNRERICLIGFRKDKAEVVLPPTSDVRRATRSLADMPTGGRTPLSAGLKVGFQLVRSERQLQPSIIPLLVVITDGRPNYTDSGTSPLADALDIAETIRRADVPSVCFDTESGPVQVGHVKKLADRMGAEYYSMQDYASEALSTKVRDVLDSNHHGK